MAVPRGLFGHGGDEFRGLVLPHGFYRGKRGACFISRKHRAGDRWAVHAPAGRGNFRESGWCKQEGSLMATGGAQFVVLRGPRREGNWVFFFLTRADYRGG